MGERDSWLAVGFCGCRGDECGVCSIALEGDAEAAAEGEVALPRCHEVAVDAVPDTAFAAGVVGDWGAGVCIVQLLLDDVGVFVAEPLWIGRRRGGDVWCGRRCWSDGGSAGWTAGG